LHRPAASVSELCATGLPLGLLPGARYDEQQAVLAPGDSVLLYSDGLVEAHNPAREMFGTERIARLVAAHDGGAELISAVIDDLRAFVGAGWEQEDDVTLVAVVCLPSVPAA